MNLSIIQTLRSLNTSCLFSSDPAYWFCVPFKRANNLSAAKVASFKGINGHYHVVNMERLKTTPLYKSSLTLAPAKNTII